jgi:hypothetical protein
VPGLIIHVLLLSAASVLATAALAGQAPLPAATDLFLRVGLTADEASRARSGLPAVRVLPANASTEVAAAGAIRIQGDLERLVAWLKDIEAFRKAIGTEAAGVIGRPPRPEDFVRATRGGMDLDALQRCQPGDCDIRMPAAYVSRFRSEVPWGTPEAAAAAAGLGRQLLAQYAAAYQSGGDAALGAHHDQKAPNAIAAEFQDMLRRATTLWNLAFPFASYLETFPGGRPVDVEERFYWTRETETRQPVTTLHHVVLQRLGDKSLRLADKQFYASRDLDAALLVGQATPLPDGKQFDLVLAVRGRSAKLGSMAARVVHGRIERELTDTLAMYLDWLRKTFALG